MGPVWWSSRYAAWGWWAAVRCKANSVEVSSPWAEGKQFFKERDQYSATIRYTVAVETPSVWAMVFTGSPAACIRRARSALDLSRAFGRLTCRGNFLIALQNYLDWFDGIVAQGEV